MTNLKYRLLVILILATALLGSRALTKQPVTFAQSGVNVSLPTTNGAASSQVTIPVTVGDTTNQFIITFDFVITYDPTVLSPVSVSAGPLATGWPLVANTGIPGQITVSAFSPNPLSGSGTLVNILFNVVGTGGASTGLTFSNFTFNEGEPTANITNGSFTVNSDPTPTPTITPTPTPSPTPNPNGIVVALPNMTGAPGTQVTIPVTVGNTDGQAIIAFDFVFTYDPAVLNAVSVTGGILPAGWAINPIFNTPGEIRGSAFGASALSGSGTLFNVVFNVTGSNGSSTALTWDTFTFNEGEPAALTTDGFFFAGQALMVDLPDDVTGAPGSQISVPVTIDDTTGQFIIAYSFQINFDEAVLSAVNTDVAGTLSDGWSVTTNTNNPGQIQVAAFSASALSGSGTLLNLVFDVVGQPNDSTALTWDNILLNEGEPAALTSDGFFTALSWTVAGQVFYQDRANRAMSGVTIDLNGGTTDQATTDLEGYSFTTETTGAHTITPSYAGPVNSITAFDAAYIAQCVAGLRNSTDCPLLAADTSGNSSLSAFDAALIAQYAAGLAGPTSRVGTWVFDPASRSYATIESDLLAEDFAAYLVGEVTGNWSAPVAAAAMQPTETAQGDASLAIMPDGTAVTLQLSQPHAGLLAFQTTIHYDTNAGRFVEAVPAAATGGWELVTNEVEPGVVILIGYGTTPVAGATELVTLRFQPNEGSGSALAPTITSVQLNEEQIWHNDGAVDLLHKQFLPLIAN